MGPHFLTALTAFAERIQHSRVQRHFLFAALTIFTVSFLGYHFGTFDQFVHLPFLKAYVDPTLYPNDPFVALRDQNYSYFWRLFEPIYRLDLWLVERYPEAMRQWPEPLILGSVLFLLHLLATHLTFWALWRLSLELFDHPLTALITAAMFAMPHTGFAGFPVIEFSLLNRTFVLPFLLLALWLFLRRRYWLAFALLGVLYNLHVLSVNFALAMFLLDCVLEWRRIGPRNTAVGLALFVIMALPVLIWRASDPGQNGSSLALRPEWLDIVARGTLLNLFYLIAPYPHILFSTLSGLSAVALFFIARRSVSSPHQRTLMIFMSAVLVILSVQVVTAHWLPITILIQLQIIRAGVFALIFAYLYFTRYIVARYQAGALSDGDALALGLALFTGTFAVAPLLAWLVIRWVKAPAWRRAGALVVIVGMLAFTVGLANALNIWRPGLYPFAQRTAWYEAQRWARDHTPKAALFITPPHLWWLFTPEWRVFSERASVATIVELMQAGLAPSHLDVWRPRFEALAPGAIAQFRGNILENIGIIARAFYGLSSDELARLARHYQASYLVVEKLQSPSRPWLVVYENEGFIIYDLRSIR